MRGGHSLMALVAMAMLSFGVLAVAAGFLPGLTPLTGAELDVMAREKAAEAIESVFTARDTRTILWPQIRNVEGPDGGAGGIFLDGARPLGRPGPDGLVNTADDDPALVEEPLSNFTREVQIRDVNLTLRELRVIIRYRVGGANREYTISTYISSYA